VTREVEGVILFLRISLPPLEHASHITTLVFSVCIFFLRVVLIIGTTQCNVSGHVRKKRRLPVVLVKLICFVVGKALRLLRFNEIL